MIRIELALPKIDILVAKYARRAPPSLPRDEIRAAAMFAVVLADADYRDGSASFSTYAMNRAERAIRNLIRKERRQPEQLPEYDIIPEVDVHTSVRPFLDRLPFMERCAVELAFLEEWTHAKVAEALGVDERTVRKYISRGLEIMRNHARNGRPKN